MSDTLLQGHSRTRLRDVAFLGVALCTFGLAAGAAGFLLQEKPFYGFEIAGLEGAVFAFEPGGPADQAGIRKGDLVRTLDGVPLFDHFSAVSGRTPGDQVVVGVLREGLPHHLLVGLNRVSQREQIFNLERLLIGLVFWGVGTVFWAFRSRHVVTASFFGASQATAALLFADVLDPTFLWAVPLSDFMMLLLGPVTLGFFATFPEQIPARTRKPLLAVVYGGAGLLMVLSLMLPLTSGLLEAALVRSARSAFLLLTMLAAVGMLLRPLATYSGIRRRALLVAGMLLGVLPVLVFTLSPYLLIGQALLEYDWTIPFLILVPLMYAYALQTGEVGKVDFIMNRGLVYSLLTIVLLTVYALLFLALDAADVIQRGYGRYFASVAIGISTAVLFNPLRIWLQRGADRFFFGNWYDYRTMVQTESERLIGTHHLPHLLEQFRQVARTMHFQAAAFLWPNGSEFELRDSFGLGEEVQGRLRIARTGEFAAYLRETHGPVMQHTLREAFAARLGSRDEQALLNSEGLDVWLPFVSKGTLRAVLILHLPDSEEELETEDMEILATLANQAAISCENIALLESLRGRLAEIERISEELIETQKRIGEAREGERLHLTRELHDGPVQDLYAIAHGLEAVRESLPAGLEIPQIHGMRTSIWEVAEKLRGICFELRPPLLAELGWDVALRTYVENFRNEHPEIEVSVDVQPPRKVLSEKEQLTMFRIVQEALQNVALHARARRVEITFTSEVGQIVLTIKDDGCGFNVPARLIELGQRGHLGLLGMSERAEGVGGALAIRSSPGAGTMLRVHLPTTESPEGVTPVPAEGRADVLPRPATQA